MPAEARAVRFLAGRRDDSVVESVHCSCRRPEFGSPHPCQAAHTACVFFSIPSLFTFSSNVSYVLFLPPFQFFADLLLSENALDPPTSFWGALAFFASEWTGVSPS